MTQIPSGAVGTVAGVMIFTIISLLAGSLVIWLTWVHHERTSCESQLLTHIQGV